MANVKASFAAVATVTSTALATLASAGAWMSAVIDNSANLYLDALVKIDLTQNTGAAASDKACYVYVYGVIASGEYPDAVTGSEGTFTINSPTQLKLIGVISMPTQSATSYKSEPMSVAAAFGGQLPERWGIVVVNAVGMALTAATVKQQGVFQTVT